MHKRSTTFALLGSVLVCFAITTAHAQFPGQRTYCNPLDIDYKYNFEQQARGISFRSGADPVIVNHKGEYFLFVTISGGWWHSKDLVNWRFIKPDVSPHQWPKEDMCAPAALSVGGRLYLFQSTFGQRPIWVMDSPDTSRLEHFNPLLPQVPGAQGPWDPAIFHDDTDRWFMYFGSSNLYPLYGIELDHANKLTYIGNSAELFKLHPERHGWERFGPNHNQHDHAFHGRRVDDEASRQILSAIRRAGHGIQRVRQRHLRRRRAARAVHLRA